MINSLKVDNTITFANKIINVALEERASDIHISYDEFEGMEIKYRIDGILCESQKLYNEIEKKVLQKNIIEIIARMKILSEMNVADKRQPQDGSFTFLNNIKERYDIRTAYLPTVNGESIVLRILKSYLENTKLETLGFLEKSQKIVEKMLQKKYGLILVSGPTGSGKSTTLLSMINSLNDGQKKIITVEDPVEIKINGVTQVQVNSQIGVTFSEVLKSTLRNDPDIIIISEIRDEITAEIAIRAALTGHLVISTIHTNDAVSTIIRLNDMGIPKYLILDSLVGVIGQRLIGKRCQKCFGENCNNCSNGYSGRISINEVLILNEKTKSILKNDDIGEKTKNNLKTQESIEFIDFNLDVKEKLEKKLIFEKDVYEYL